MPLQSINPATGDVLRTFTTWDEDALRTRIAQAHEAATLQRSLPLEHRLLPAVLALLASRRLQWRADVVQFDGRPLPTPLILGEHGLE